MLALALALAAAAPTVIDAERAFAQMAQEQGQWTAFRATAAPDAVMFVPQPVKAHEFLAKRKDPPKAICWQPTQAWVSCDGTLAVDTGNWQSADGKTVGYFTTVWQRQPDGSWKWVYDGGDELPATRPAVADPVVVRSSCEIPPPPPIVEQFTEHKEGGYYSPDFTLYIWWFVQPDGQREFEARAGATGIVIHDSVSAPPK